MALTVDRTAAQVGRVSDEDAADLRRFLAAVFSRGESPGARRWIGNPAALPSGRSYRAEDWQSRLIAPCLAVGLLTAPTRNGEGYGVNRCGYVVAEPTAGRSDTYPAVGLTM